MSTRIKIKAAGRKFDLSPDEARALYDELRKVYDVTAAWSVPSVWTWPNGDDLSSVTTLTPSPDGCTTVRYDNGNGQQTYTRTEDNQFLCEGA